MSSKYCPKCGRIVSSNTVPNYCAWGCGSLENEPLLPPHREWPGGYYGMVEIARKEYEARQNKLITEEIKPGVLQIKLF